MITYLDLLLYQWYELDITKDSYNSKGRYYKHSTRDVYYYYDRRYKKWVMSDAMNDKEAFGYLDESTECPNMTKMSPLMAKGNGQNYSNRSSDYNNPFSLNDLVKDGYYANYFEKSNILTGCTRASDKQIYQCSLPNVYPEISTPVGSVGLAGNTRGISKTIVTDNDYFSEFTRIQGMRLISIYNTDKLPFK